MRMAVQPSPLPSSPDESVTDSNPDHNPSQRYGRLPSPRPSPIRWAKEWLFNFRAFAPLHAAFNWLVSTLVLLTLCPGGTTWASLDAYDVAISEDASAGLNPLAHISSVVMLTGSNKAAFNFGTNSGSATMEFILDGDPSVNPSAYLAVGANSTSNLRYDLWNDTGQLGFTQLGVMDYAFTPGVPSPTQPAHVTYVWNTVTSTMRLFLNGTLAGTCSGVSPSFAMPSGPGWLGANPQGGEPMVGTIYRLTVYDGMVSEEVILSHANAFNGVVFPPDILSFTANPETVFSPRPRQRSTGTSGMPPPSSSMAQTYRRGRT